MYSDNGFAMRDKKIPPKLTLIITVVLLALIVLTAIVWGKQLNRNQSYGTTNTADTSAQVTPDNTDLPAGPEESKDTSIIYPGEDGKTALEILKQKADVITQDSAYGEYVDSINGVKGGEDGKYWAFYVNREMAQVGAGEYQTKSTDRIEWKFE